MDAIMYLVMVLVGISIYAGVSRWVFKVNDHIENQELIIQLLCQLLIQQGLTEQEVNKILNKKK